MDELTRLGLAKKTEDLGLRKALPPFVQVSVTNEQSAIICNLKWEENYKEMTTGQDNLASERRDRMHAERIRDVNTIREKWKRATDAFNQWRPRLAEEDYRIIIYLQCLLKQIECHNEKGIGDWLTRLYV